MAYKVLKDGTTIQKQVSERPGNRNPNRLFPVYITKTYAAGVILPEEDVAPVIREKYDDGDERVKSLIEKVSDSEINGGSEVSVFNRDEFQRENAGPVDQPRKAQQGFTGQDSEDEEKVAIVEAAGVGDSSDDDSSTETSSKKKSK